MSFFPAKDPAPGDALRCDAIAHVIVPRGTDLGGFQVRRALPSAQRRMVGPMPARSCIVIAWERWSRSAPTRSIG